MIQASWRRLSAYRREPPGWSALAPPPADHTSTARDQGFAGRPSPANMSHQRDSPLITAPERTPRTRAKIIDTETVSGPRARTPGGSAPTIHRRRAEAGPRVRDLDGVQRTDAGGSDIRSGAARADRLQSNTMSYPTTRAAVYTEDGITLTTPTVGQPKWTYCSTAGGGWVWERQNSLVNDTAGQLAAATPAPDPRMTCWAGAGREGSSRAGPCCRRAKGWAGPAGLSQRGAVEALRFVAARL
ncbi:hypothetical protein H4W31_001017 [Plantactinospora soyae]|uniref:Uncharacterized protein n=1 Tax=Plantactinospora soyae TaxID=1544732 RepID=A0A927LZR1_9ACTN|nr:hypothetical protein [Plantactinospora soyae]